jgi:hypothetical protein
MMMSVTIEYQDGRVTDVESVDAAMGRIENDYPDAVYGEWEPAPSCDGATECERMLVWEDAAAAGPDGTGDDGSHSVCEIIRTCT